MSLIGLSGGPSGARSRLRLMIDDDGDTFLEVDAHGDFEADWSTTDSWAFFAISYAGEAATSTIKFYSGSLAAAASLSASQTESAIVFPLAGASVCIGAEPSSSVPFKGYLDDFRLYGTALTAAEIEQVRSGGVRPQPRLRIAPAGAGSVRISWASSFTDHVLEFAPGLPATDWSAVTNAATIAGDRFSVTLNTGEAQRVYRLRGP